MSDAETTGRGAAPNRARRSQGTIVQAAVNLGSAIPSRMSSGSPRRQASRTVRGHPGPTPGFLFHARTARSPALWVCRGGEKARERF